MDLFLRGEYADAMDAFEEQISDIEDTGSAEDQDLATLTLRCNVAYCQLKLEMFRKCISGCRSMIASNGGIASLRAHLLAAKAMLLLEQEEEALGMLDIALAVALAPTNTNVMCDAALVEEIAKLRETCVSPNKSNKSDDSDKSAVDVTGTHGSMPVSVLVSAPASTEKDPASTEKEEGRERAKEKAEQSGSGAAVVKAGKSNTNANRKPPTAPQHKQVIEIESPSSATTITRDMLHATLGQLLANFGQPVSPLILKSVRQNLAHACGDELLDDLISLGYLHVNTGGLETACQIFQLLLQYRKDLPAAYIGLGSAFAMTRDFRSALSAFGQAIAVAPHVSDAWKRRGQTRCASGDAVEGILDLIRARELDPSDPDVHFQLGAAFHRQKDYQRALPSFKQSLLLDNSTSTTSDSGDSRDSSSCASLHNFIGMCYGQLGEIAQSIDSHRLAHQADASFREALLNEGQMHKELGHWERALDRFALAIKLGANTADSGHSSSSGISSSSSNQGNAKGKGVFVQGYSYRAQLLYSLGRVEEAVMNYQVCLTQQALEGQSVADIAQTRTSLGVCHMACGSYSKAIQQFDYVLLLEHHNDHYCWFHREMALLLWAYLDTPHTCFSLDRKSDTRVKDGWCRRAKYKACMAAHSEEGSNPYQALLAPTPSLLSPKQEQEQEQKLKLELESSHRLHTACVRFGKGMQLDSKGFLPNVRQHAQFGLAVMEMSCALRKHIISRNQFKHVNRDLSLDWRLLMDIAVRWRQLSEPQDPVWWIDGMPLKAFEEGFGLQTPLVNGQLKTVRYYPYFDKAFHRMKAIAQTTYFDAASSRKCPTTQQRARIGQATTLDELHNAVGEDFYCVVPCRPARPNSRNSKTSSSSSSSNKQGQVEGAREGEGEGEGKKFEGEEFEGTRLTLLKTQDPDPPGFDFSIRTPGTPLRWTQFAAELQHQFTSMMDLLSTLHSRPADIDTGIDIYTDVDVDVYARADKDIDAKIQKSKGNGSEVIIDTEALLRHALTFFYYWVTFAPLSRGSAACGYAVLHSMLLAGGYELTTSTGKNTFMKRGVQLDWEAILAEDVSSFVETALPLMATENIHKSKFFADTGLDELKGKKIKKAVVQGVQTEDLRLLHTIRGNIFLLNNIPK